MQVVFESQLEASDARLCATEIMAPSYVWNSHFIHKVLFNGLGAAA